MTVLLTVLPPVSVEAQPVLTELGAMPAEAQFPKVEFAVEAGITLGPVRVVGETRRDGASIFRLPAVRSHAPS